MGWHEHDGTSGDLTAWLELLNDRAMPGLERATIGEWRLRAALAATGRSNSVWPIGSAGSPLDEAIAEVEDWYAAQKLRPMFMIYDGADSGLVRELDRRGWVTGNQTLVMVADIEAGRLGDVSTLGDGDWTVEVSDGPRSASMALMNDDDRMTEVTATDLEQRFAIVTDSDGTLLGGGTATIDGEWCGLLAMKTVPEARRRGVARVVLDVLLEAVADLGAKRAWLQVEARNTGAVALYAGAGFVRAHAYRYRAAPAGSNR